MRILGVSSSLALFLGPEIVWGCVEIPVGWSTDTLRPTIALSVSIENLSSSTTCMIDTRPFRDGGLLWIEGDVPRVIEAQLSFGNVHYWREIIEEVEPNGAAQESMPRLSVAPTSRFSYSVDLFVLTHDRLIVNPERPLESYCVSGSDPELQFGATEDDEWYFTVGTERFIIDTTNSNIVLSQEEAAGYWSEVDSILASHQLSRGTMGHLNGGECDLDFLDEILPSFSYSLSHDFEIIVSPRQYIHERSCRINVVSYSNSRRIIGAPVLRDHALFFDPNAGRIGICRTFL